MDKVYNEELCQWEYRPVGDIDIQNSNEIKKEILGDFSEKEGDILIDGKDLEYIDSTGLGAIIAIYKEVNDRGKKIIFTNLAKFVHKLFKITDMDKLFEIRGVENGED
ncbi:MAG: STAS domain-containing protein [Tissierellia bacterium]|nr:STAS domain-containing protein [Tissierellia bacterium]